MNGTIPNVDKGVNHENCSLGLWLASINRQQAERYASETKELFNNIYEPHKTLHNNVLKTKQLVK